MPNNLRCAIVRTEEQCSQVSQLRYDGYRRDESIPPNGLRQFRDDIDSEPNHFSFLVTDEQQRAS